MRHFVSRWRRDDFNIETDPHGVSIDKCKSHPGYAVFEDRRFLGYVKEITDKEFCDVEEWSIED